jgi:hypothetical protein
VTTPGGTNVPSSADQFTVQATPVPVVNSVGPTSGPAAGGTTVVLVGTGFTGATAVTFNGVPATNVVVSSDSRLTATSPAQNAGTYDVKVTTAGGTSAPSSADQYTYVGTSKVPAVSSISPTSGSSAGGTSVTIRGTNFTGATQVHFGTVAASSFSVSSSTKITTTAPAESAGAHDVTVTTPNGTSATVTADQFTAVTPPPVPTVTQVSPNSGPTSGGTAITITGSGFSAGATVVIGQGNGSGNGAVAAKNVTVVSPTQITATTGSGAKAGTWNLMVITAGGTSAANSGDYFTYNAPPVVPSVSRVSPTSGPRAGGTTITITGKGFVAGATVVIGQGNGAGTGAIAATNVTVVSSTQITATTGGGAKAGTWNLMVITAGGTSAANPGDNFTYH